MGLADKLKEEGIKKTTMSIRVEEKSGNLLEFYLKADKLEGDGDRRFVYGPVVPNTHPEHDDNGYLDLVKNLVSEEIHISEKEAKKLIIAAQVKIEACAIAGIEISNKRDFYYIPE
ncbi:hypothetical protein GOV06_05010 [Candidatus Woesearchaeota archaeon]|nr:hypothetical protein [Candidatus Woesearchaeota archaeon]